MKTEKKKTPQNLDRNIKKKKVIKRVLDFKNEQDWLRTFFSSYKPLSKEKWDKG